MKTISLEKALTILEEALGIIIQDGTGTLMYPDTLNLTEDSNNEFMYISEDETRMVNTIHFCENGNEEVKISDSSMFLYDTSGVERELTILVRKQLI